MQAPSESREDLTRPRVAGGRPGCALRVPAAMALLRSRALGAAVVGGVGGAEVRPRPPAHLCMRSCSSRCLRISGNCFS